MAEYEGESLARWPQLNRFNLADQPHGHTIHAMQQTGFHTWGFVIYRCTYSDDAAWNRYLAFMHKEIAWSLGVCGTDLLLTQYLDMTVVEDPSTLNNALKAAVRDHFETWVDANQDQEKGGPGWDNPIAQSIPRFRFCIYVDQKCLDTLQKRVEWEGSSSRSGRSPAVVCAMIDLDCEPGGEGRGGYPDLEGCTREYPGWMYLSLRMIPGQERLTDSRGRILRPPEIYPEGSHQSMPV
ncbi:unnamed protein product [Clonostachys solani]|uniref:Uncharacterized protein n=1 Tax=Clonostachys solani TaxID=160281 RepID=A0A9N9YWS5_9HYPO|nr:unnamed protein product [Clonostachys solani]